ncbi:hypothetical protein CR513_38485, partial [Mucuna pruriens]
MGDGIILEILANRFMSEVQVPEAPLENVHSEMYSLLLDTYVKDSTQKVHLFDTIDNISLIAIFRKAFTHYLPSTIPIDMETFQEGRGFILDEDGGGWDSSQWNSLTKSGRNFRTHVIAFFAIRDGILLYNLASRFVNEVQVAEARAFYSFQAAMENVHSEMYILLLDSYFHRYENFTRRQRLHFERRGGGPLSGPLPIFMNQVQVPESRAFYNFQIAMENVHSEMYSLLLDTYFFYIGDDIILENLASRFMNKVQVSKAHAFYSFQIAIENVHSEMFTSSAPLITSALSPSLEKLLCDLLVIKHHSIGKGPKRGPPPSSSSHRYGNFTRRQRLHFRRQKRWTSPETSPNETLSPMVSNIS